ncbi:MAG: hypothetical protein J6T10_06530 [Methanobrevibacter sp.]|nr:hypothetical protein [Methanobrevibacter sp.]
MLSFGYLRTSAFTNKFTRILLIRSLRLTQNVTSVEHRRDIIRRTVIYELSKYDLDYDTIAKEEAKFIYELADECVEIIDQSFSVCKGNWMVNPINCADEYLHKSGIALVKKFLLKQDFECK